MAKQGKALAHAKSENPGSILGSHTVKGKLSSDLYNVSAQKHTHTQRHTVKQF